MRPLLSACRDNFTTNWQVGSSQAAVLHSWGKVLRSRVLAMSENQVNGANVNQATTAMNDITPAPAYVMRAAEQ